MRGSGEIPILALRATVHITRILAKAGKQGGVPSLYNLLILDPKTMKLGTLHLGVISCEYSKEGRQVNKWKNHFYEMKGDVGMSCHEKEREQEDQTESHL